MAERKHSSKLLVVLSIAALIVVDLEVSADQRGRSLQRYGNDNDDDDMIFSGDVDSSGGGSGLEQTDNENKMWIKMENCSHKNKSACSSQLLRRSTLVPVYGTGSRIVTRKLISEAASVTSSYRSLVFSPVRSTELTSSRNKILDYSTAPSVAGQLPCNSVSSVSRDDCIRTSSSSIEDDDIEIVEETSGIIGNETKPNGVNTASDPDELLGPRKANEESSSTSAVKATSRGLSVIKFWTKPSILSTTTSPQLQMTSDIDQQQLPSLADDTTSDAGKRPLETEHPNHSPIPGNIESNTERPPPPFVDYNDVVTRLDLDSRQTTSRVRFIPVGFATPNGFAIQLHASSERYAALVLNMALLTGIALLLILLIVVLACLILYRRRRTRCGGGSNDDIITTPTIITPSCHRAGVTSSSTVPTRMTIDARRPPAYQQHPVIDDQRLFDVTSCRSSVAGSKGKVDPTEWFV